MKKMVMLLMVCLMAAATYAASVPVTNYSYELPGTGKITGWDNVGNDVPGWASNTVAADSGVESDWPGHTDGVYTAFVYNLDSSIWNLTDHIIAAGEVFTLQVDARNNWTNSTDTGDLMISLYYDVAGVRNTVASTTFADISDTWTTFSLIFSADDVAASIGSNIGIELDSVQPDANRSYLGMDNVRLDVVPEPATLSLLGLGVLGMLRKRK